MLAKIAQNSLQLFYFNFIGPGMKKSGIFSTRKVRSILLTFDNKQIIRLALECACAFACQWNYTPRSFCEGSGVSCIRESPRSKCMPRNGKSEKKSEDEKKNFNISIFQFKWFNRPIQKCSCSFLMLECLLLNDLLAIWLDESIKQWFGFDAGSSWRFGLE